MRKLYNKDPTTPQMCCYTTLWDVLCLKSNNWKQDFCHTHFQKLTTGNNVFIVCKVTRPSFNLKRSIFLHCCWTTHS